MRLPGEIRRFARNDQGIAGTSFKNLDFSGQRKSV